MPASVPVYLGSYYLSLTVGLLSSFTCAWHALVTALILMYLDATS